MARKTVRIRRNNPMEPIETFQYKGKTIEIHYDPEPMNPRVEWDNIGTILYWSGRYKLGDKKVGYYDAVDIINQPGIISLNVYAYIHSGTTLKTTPFGESERLDSGQSGVIYVTEKDALKAFNRKRMTPALRKKVEKTLRAEVSVYSEYINGEVYGYVILDASGEHVDSLWGIYDLAYARSAAKEAI